MTTSIEFEKYVLVNFKRYNSLTSEFDRAIRKINFEEMDDNEREQCVKNIKKSMKKLRKLSSDIQLNSKTREDVEHERFEHERY